MKYGVTCLTDDGERVVVTRKRWDTREEAQAYADTVAESRFAKVHLMCRVIDSRAFWRNLVQVRVGQFRAEWC